MVMNDPDSLESLRGLHQDLLALSEARLTNVERLWIELESRVEEFRKLLDKPPKNEKSRQTVLAGEHRKSLPRTCLYRIAELI